MQQQTKKIIPIAQEIVMNKFVLNQQSIVEIAEECREADQQRDRLDQGHGLGYLNWLFSLSILLLGISLNLGFPR